MIRALLLPPVFLLALLLMMPALIENRVPVDLWPTYVMYALFC